MSYNKVTFAAVVFSLCLAYSVSVGVVVLFFEQSAWKDIVQLLVAIFILTTFYSTIKHFMLQCCHNENTKNNT